MRYHATLVRGLNYRVHRPAGDIAFEHGVPVEVDEATKRLLANAVDWRSEPSVDQPGAIISRPVPKFAFVETTDKPAPAGTAPAIKGAGNAPRS